MQTLALVVIALAQPPTHTPSQSQPNAVVSSASEQIAALKARDAAELAALVARLENEVPPYASPSSVHLRGQSTDSSTTPLPSPYFAHIPRTGGTSIEIWGAENGLLWGYPRVLRNATPAIGGASDPPACKITSSGTPPTTKVHWGEGGCCSQWHIPPRRFAGFDPSVPLFTVIREPVERILSSIALRKVPCELADAFISTTIGTARAGQHPYDCHWLPQSEWFTDQAGARLPNTRVLCYSKDRRQIAHELRGLFPGMPAMNTTAMNKSEKPHCSVTDATGALLRAHFAADVLWHQKLCAPPAHQPLEVAAGWAASSVRAAAAGATCSTSDVRGRTWDKPMQLRLKNARVETGETGAVLNWIGPQPSGPGSRASHTQLHREMLGRILSSYGVRTLIDVPCGDMTWMPLVELHGATYFGGDISPSIVKFNRDRFGDGGDDPRFTRGSFDVVDITCNVLPTYGMPAPALLHCKDVLFHMSTADALATLRNFEASSAEFLVTTTHNFLAHGAVNDWDPVRQGDGAYADANYSAGDVKIGYNQVDLRRPPFCFPEPLVASRPHNGSFEKDPSQLGIVNGLWRLPALGAFVGNHCVDRQGVEVTSVTTKVSHRPRAKDDVTKDQAVGATAPPRGTGVLGPPAGLDVDAGWAIGSIVIHLYFRHIPTANPKHSEDWYVVQLDTACGDLAAAGLPFVLLGSAAWIVSRAPNCSSATARIELSSEAVPHMREVSRVGHNCTHFKFGTKRVPPMPPGLLRQLVLVWVDKLPALCRAAPPGRVAMLVDAALPHTNPALWQEFILQPASALLGDPRVNLTRLNTECYDRSVRFGVSNPNQKRFGRMFGDQEVCTTNVVNANYLMLDTAQCPVLLKAFDAALEAVSAGGCRCWDEEIVMSQMYLNGQTLFNFPRGCTHK